MLFAVLARTLQRIEQTSSTIAMRDILSNFFNTIPKTDISNICNLLEGQVASSYKGIVFGVAEQTIIKAMAKAYGQNEAVIATVVKRKGDTGLTAESFASAKEPTLPLTLVFSQIEMIAKTTGKGSQDAKINLISQLLSKSTPIESRYLTRILVGQLRLGAGTMTILDSLSISYLGGKQHRKELEQAYNICPDIAHIAEVAATKGLSGIKKVGIIVGRPIKMMLATRVDSLLDIKDKMKQICAEEKYDGERIQAHFDGKKITLYSRRMDTITEQFPDVVEALKKCIPFITTKSYVIEGECCAVDSKGNLEPFQKLMKRKRKYDVTAYAKQVPVTLFLFDLLFLDGKTFLHKPLIERQHQLQSILKKRDRTLSLARHVITDKINEVQRFFTAALARGCEGIIAKNAGPEGVYQAGTRGWLWIKWKREYSKELQDTFDLVVVGAFQGKGKRGGGYGALLCAAYNKSTDSYETVCKLGSGFTDEELSSLGKRLSRYKNSSKPANVSSSTAQEPDVWFIPGIVLEVLGAELTRSPTHTCAQKDGKGLALRFPRFIRWRDDKGPEQATTSSEIEKMAKNI